MGKVPYSRLGRYTLVLIFYRRRYEIYVVRAAREETRAVDEVYESAQ